MDKPYSIPRSGQSVKTLLTTVESRLRSAPLYYGHGTDNVWDEAVQLVLSAMGFAADAGEEVLGEQASEQQVERIMDLLQQRVEQRVPLPYLVGKAWFAGLEFKCDARALVPRSPLAELILNAFSPWYNVSGPLRVLDLCCGGGSIGLAAAHYFPDAQVDLVDISEPALALARENAALLGVEARASIFASDVFSGIPAGRTYDIILSNPPYVNAVDLAAMPAEYHHEPGVALGSGPDGLDLTHRILRTAGQYLAPGGVIFVELGYSWPALESAYPDVPFTWLDFEHGGEGVFTLDAKQWQHYSESWSR